MRILFVTFGLPYPPDSGVRIHDFHLIKNISRHDSVLLLSLIISPEQVEYVDQLRRYCDMVVFRTSKASLD
jgi:hypothetical protein